MCGIAGFIGQSKNPKTTYDIITSVFSRTEVRGIDAAGFWGTNEEGHVIYHKEPVRSSELVKMDVWKKVSRFNPDLLLVHARQASAGDPSHNKNNHPFTSTDRILCLIHNGRVPEFDVLKNKFQVLSNCDSEILLRIIEAASEYTKAELDTEFPDTPQEISSRLIGIRDVFSLINYGHMAVALGEMLFDGERHLYLFRNRFRSLWAVDLREVLGQVFFCSTPEIWQEAVSDCDGKILNRQKLVEIPPEEVWHFSINKDKRHAHSLKRMKVHRGPDIKEWKDNGVLLPVRRRNPIVNVITKLDDHDELAETRVRKKQPEDCGHILSELNHTCVQIRDLNNRIQTLAYNLNNENSISSNELYDVLDRVRNIKVELEGTLRIMEG